MSTYTNPIEPGQPGPSFATLVGQSWGIRAGARIIDMLVMLVASFVTGGLIGGVLGFAASRGAQLTKIQQAGNIDLNGYAFGILATFAYFVICQTFHGSSIGKMILGLVVVNEDGTPAGLTENIKREILYFIDGFFFGLVALSSINGTALKQRLGDRWARTLVVRRSEVRPENLQPWGTFMVVSLMALILSTLLNVMPVVLRLL